MACGSGTRFWPRTRQRVPNHLLPIVARHRLLAHTLARGRRQSGGGARAGARVRERPPRGGARWALGGGGGRGTAGRFAGGVGGIRAEARGGVPGALEPLERAFARRSPAALARAYRG